MEDMHKRISERGPKISVKNTSFPIAEILDIISNKLAFKPCSNKVKDGMKMGGLLIKIMG